MYSGSSAFAKENLEEKYPLLSYAFFVVLLLVACILHCFLKFNSNRRASNMILVCVVCFQYQKN